MTQPLFNSEKIIGTKLKQDDLGLLFVLYDLWEQHPERFGSNNLDQLATKQSIAEIIEKRNTNALTVVPALIKLFAEKHINPFKDISDASKDTTIVNISPVTYHKDVWQPITALCAEYRPIAESVGTDSEHVNVANIGEMVEGRKADYVISGNVLNYIENEELRGSFMRAAAMATNKGGRVIHLLDLDNEMPHDALNHFVVHDKNYDVNGQRFLRTIPESSWQKKGQPLLAVVATQQREIGFDGVEVPHDATSGVDASTLGLRGRIQDIDGKKK